MVIIIQYDELAVILDSEEYIMYWEGQEVLRSPFFDVVCNYFHAEFNVAVTGPCGS